MLFTRSLTLLKSLITTNIKRSAYIIVSLHTNHEIKLSPNACVYKKLVSGVYNNDKQFDIKFEA